MASDGSFTYEQETRLSESILWKLLEHYYSQSGLEAWDHIPFYPTSNPFIAEAYAEVMIGVLLDTLPILNLDEPVYILEMATGSGIFSYYLMKQLLHKLEQFDSLSKIKLCYVMTDFTRNNVDGWKPNPILTPFIEAGVLDFAVFSPETQDSVFLDIAQKHLSAQTVENPVFAIANYFFDSLRQDSFRLDETSTFQSKLFEGRVTLQSPYETVLFGDLQEQAQFMEQLEKSETFFPCPINYYENPIFNQVLKAYQKSFTNASILFPLGALHCIENLQKISGNQLILISTDKGFTQASYMQGHYEHQITPHHGAFSYMVNFDALGLYFDELGGCALKTVDKNPVVASMVGVLLADHPNLSLSFTRYAFRQRFIEQNKLNDMYYCQTFVFNSDHKTKKELFNTYMAMLRLSLHDPIMFCGLADKLYETLVELDADQTALLLEGMEIVKGNIFVVRPEHNALFWLGKLYYGMSRIPEAMAVFQEAVEVFGEEDCYSMFHLGACHEMNQEYEKALLAYEKAKRFLTDCPMTQAALERVTAQMV
ncbi:MAG: tetratricopeptide repeat protein [Cyanobacteria bacterium]|nr:tetratricopeptide repeat protein [Cyanobacteriota bacterium]